MKYYVLIAIMFLATCMLKAQEITIDELLNSEEIQLENPVISDLLKMTQIQSDYVVNQFINVAETDMNISAIEQEGYYNLATVGQNGHGHISLLSQKGTNNQAFLLSSGKYTSQFVTQNGDGNIIDSRVENQGWIPKVAVLKQKGSNNSINLDMTGNGVFQEGWPVAAYISQAGNDLGINAVFDRYESPLFINQQSGPTGGGMQLNITTSDFYFPMK